VAPAGRSEKAGALSEQFMWEPVGRRRDLSGREQCDRIHTVRIEKQTPRQGFRALRWGR